MNVEGQAPELVSSATAECGERCRVISSMAGGGASTASPMPSSSGTNLGLTMCAAGAAQFTAETSAGVALAQGGRNTNCIQRADTVATHSDMNKVIVIN